MVIGGVGLSAITIVADRRPVDRVNAGQDNRLERQDQIEHIERMGIESETRCVTILELRPKIFYKTFTWIPCELIFQMLGGTMWISDY